MATYGIKINAGIQSTTILSTTTITTIYTAPSNGYAIISYVISVGAGTISGASGILYITGGGVMSEITAAVSTSQSTAVATNTSPATLSPGTIYVGPSCSIKFQMSSSSLVGAPTAIINISGVEFVS